MGTLPNCKPLLYLYPPWGPRVLTLGPHGGIAPYTAAPPRKGGGSGIGNVPIAEASVTEASAMGTILSIAYLSRQGEIGYTEGGTPILPEAYREGRPPVVREQRVMYYPSD